MLTFFPIMVLLLGVFALDLMAAALSKGNLRPNFFFICTVDPRPGVMGVVQLKHGEQRQSLTDKPEPWLSKFRMTLTTEAMSCKMSIP